MDFNQVRYFLALADTLNFTRAAEICHISQSALTQAIRRMETELGGELVFRKGRNSELTPLGKSLRGHFEKIDYARNKVKLTAQAMTANETKKLHIGIMCTIGPQVIAKLLEQFQLNHPDFAIILHDVTQEHIPSLLISGAIDGAFCSRESSQQKNKFCFYDLYREDLVVAFKAGHELSLFTEAPLKIITKYPYIDRLRCEFRDDFFKFCDQADLQLNVIFSSQREDWIQSMVANGVGISVIPELSLIHPTIEYRKIKDPELSRRVEFTLLDRENISMELEMLIEYLKEQQPFFSANRISSDSNIFTGKNKEESI